MGKTNLFFRSITDVVGLTDERKTKRLEREDRLKDMGIYPSSSHSSNSKPMSAKQQAKEQAKYEQSLEKERAKYAKKAENKAKMGAMLKSSMGMPSATDQASLSGAKLSVGAVSFEQASAEKIYEGIAQLVNEAKSNLLPKGLMDRQAMFLKGNRLALYESIRDKVEIGLLKLNGMGGSDTSFLVLAQKKQAELADITSAITKHRKRLLMIFGGIVAGWVVLTVIMLAMIK
ncbi:hypothetical protein [Entomospira culicis]|uniref:Uncharacterized protein n=1 Tax=Entomospira culicis TaxID=2719989 RepID=A0A968GGN0_9SPIO|nr:hypothetical protein [Entomospira culicis]NIZ20002.1 hypothetical protein [Entomospira culicis]NIZ70196.1 hypothetical protein [Entomospira culicis]WDI38091.1 hypothetical protein PVA46_08240 [Entomospira culicis]WDI39713.1 hypothetical protein PVA47_08240 [Entomospira culicis]